MADYVKQMRERSAGELGKAFGAFVATPSARNFHRLSDAMLTFQALKYPEPGRHFPEQPPFVKFLNTHAPTPEEAAKLIQLTVSTYPDVRESFEPYRCAAYRLGFAELDGTPWWQAVMDIIG